MLEIIALTLEDAIQIELGGGQRIELISAYSEGGLTPSYGLIEAVCREVSIPVNVMIRPHSNSFVYSDEEIEIMKKDIKIAKEIGANGVVFGVLTPENEIDVEKVQKLLKVCDGLDVTFHRAIEDTDVVKSLKLLRDYPQITTILTSGGLSTPIEENIEAIKTLIAESNHIDVLLGYGLNLGNVAFIKERSKATHFHFGSAVRTECGIDLEMVKKISQIVAG